MKKVEAGFTLVEVMTALAIFGIASGIAVTGMRSWASSLNEKGGAQTIVAEMRRVQQEAVTEGRTFCVNFDVLTSRYTVYRGTCDDPNRSRLRGPIPTPTGTFLASPAFAGPGGLGTGVTFLPRGTAWAGSVQLTRPRSYKTYTISVEALTGRVSVA